MRHRSGEPAVITPLENVESRPRRVALGKFDGVHLGHRRVIDGADTVVTFDRHPLSLLAPGDAPGLLATLERRAELVGSLGVRELVVVRFDHAVASLTPERFVDEVLVGALRATQVSVGANFRFGRGAAGDSRTLASDGRFATRVAPLAEVDGRRVSATWIRELVSAGDLDTASRLLGARFALSGAAGPGGEVTLSRDHVRPPAGTYLVRARARGVVQQGTAGLAPGGRLRLDLRGPWRVAAGESVQVELMRRMPPIASGQARDRRRSPATSRRPASEPERR